jgi:alpha-ribazole phosphatase
MKLVLIRHPQPEVELGICYGKTDLSLRVSASESAQDLIPKLIEKSQAPFHIACSPLTRCKQFGLALSALQPSAAISFDARLQELDFGDWEMQPWDSIGKVQMDAWIESGFDAIHGGESLRALDARVASWLQDARGTYESSQSIWVVAHAGVIRSLLRQQKVCSFNDSLSWPIGYSEFIELNLD